MKNNEKIVIPKNLLKFAKKTSFVSAGVICAHQESVIESTKEAYELGLINPIFIGNKKLIEKITRKLKWDISNFKIYEEISDKNAAAKGAELAKKKKIKIMIKGNIHTDILMKIYLKKEFGLIEGKRLSHIWHMTRENNDKPLFITDGALNVLPRLEVKMHILKNVINFSNKIGITKPRIAILSGTEDPIESMPSSIEAKKIMERAKKEKIKAYVHGPLAFDNAVSPEAAKIKKIHNNVAGKADVLLVPNLETGNALSKIMVYFMGACAAGFIVGGKVPVVVTSRADNSASRLASIAAAVIAAN
tara:strand:- start:59 stop:970 length:912 start_codon:yes stop_codon:yes gene_type:complete